MAIDFTAGTGNVPIPDFVSKQHKLLTEPVCPAFPDASLFLGELSCWFFNFCAWMRIPLGRTLKRPLHALMGRRDRVAWFRKPAWERAIALGVVSFALIIPLPFASLWTPMGVKPPGKLR